MTLALPVFSGRVGPASPSERQPTHDGKRASWWVGARYAILSHPTARNLQLASLCPLNQGLLAHRASIIFAPER